MLGIRNNTNHTAVGSGKLSVGSTATASKTEETKNGTVTTSAQGDTVSISAQGTAAAANSSSSSSSSQDLSSYSATQLKQMLNDGEISQTEYNKAIAALEEKNAASASGTDSSEEKGLIF